MSTQDEEEFPAGQDLMDEINKQDDDTESTKADPEARGCALIQLFYLQRVSQMHRSS